MCDCVNIITVSQSLLTAEGLKERKRKTRQKERDLSPCFMNIDHLHINKRQKMNEDIEHDRTMISNNQDETSGMDARALNKFSRQIAALGNSFFPLLDDSDKQIVKTMNKQPLYIVLKTGADTTAKLIKLSVLVVGLRGIGVETVKNLALQGVGSITVIDSNVVEAKDM